MNNSENNPRKPIMTEEDMARDLWQDLVWLEDHSRPADIFRLCEIARTALKRAILAETTITELEFEAPAYNPNFGDDKKCACGHSYYRHFDSYDEMNPVGCKYCDCLAWHAPEGDISYELDPSRVD